MKKTVSRALFVSILLSSVLTSSVVADTEKLDGAHTNEELIYDGAPIVYIESDDDLPPSMKRVVPMSEERKQEKEALRKKKQMLREEYRRKRGQRTASPNAIIMPSVNILQNPQDTDYYCGYACLQSILEYHGIDKTQREIASEAYYADDSLAWFIGNQSQAADEKYYPAAKYLDAMVSHPYEPYNSYFGSFTKSDFVEMVRIDIDDFEEGIMVCGESSKDGNSQLPKYPEESVRHWIVIDGYDWDNVAQKAMKIHFVDPASGADSLSWGGTVLPYSKTETGTMYNFARARGIIW